MNRDIEILSQDTTYDVSADTNTVIKKAYSPKIVDNIWYVYNDSTKEYESTGINAKGQKGDTGSQGIPGTNGTNGTNGADGYSPSATVSKTGNTATITITDKNGTTITTVKDGETGATGQPGQNGTNGTDGKSLEYNWNGTKLGIKRDDETSYQYVDLKGEAGESYDDTEIRGLISNKQDTLVSGTNIKTINDESILGEGNITIEGGGTGINFYNLGTLATGGEYLSNSTYYAEFLRMINNVIFNNEQVFKFSSSLPYLTKLNFAISQDGRYMYGDTYMLRYIFYYIGSDFNTMSYSNYASLQQCRYDLYVLESEKNAGEILNVYSSRYAAKGYVKLQKTDVIYGFSTNQIDKVLKMDNTIEFTPTSDYNPATKKYVDDQIGNINSVLATLVNVEE